MRETDAEINRQIVSVSSKRKATENLYIQPKKIILKELSENTQLTDGFTSNDYNVIRKSVYRSRRKVLPLIPTTIAEAHIVLNTLETTFTTKNEPFVLVNDEIKNIIIFSCKTNLTFLCNVVETIYMDGTFQFCAKFFEQMFYIHGFKNGHYIPLIFILLPDKNYETYVYTFKSIVNKCKELGLVFIPKFVTIDFEKAIHLAVNEVWSSSKIVGCRFHLTQACFGLIFLEPSEVSDCFIQDLMAECPTDEKLVKYCDYLVENYISENSVFSPTLWARNSASIQLTTNACELFHSYFNKNFYSNSPSIISWLNIIRNDIQTETYIKINSVEIPKKTKDKKNEGKTRI
ncbi:hypothetical protein AGLY_006573 [Aphis glycines]|uniref:MULE transposase domain-containing protein n=1 Tax=Aphis glycines TaxID=307491 RepID=A0A6G0TRF0_APHGL|nr:hypothetical protein AGLY_006573 [Aphis glycines]